MFILQTLELGADALKFPAESVDFRLELMHLGGEIGLPISGRCVVRLLRTTDRRKCA